MSRRATATPSLPTLGLALQFGAFTGHEQVRALLTRARLRRWLSLALVAPAQLGVRVVGRAEGQALNRQYRGRDYATNVLTFAYSQHPVLSADLVLCAPVIAREARVQGKPLLAHYAHLLIHGALHAQGFDHEQDEQAALEMEASEIMLMHTLGFANPY